MTFRPALLPTLFASAVLAGCASNTPATTPEPAAATPAAAQPAPATTAPATATPASAELTDERTMALGREYAALLHAGEFAKLWEKSSPEAQARFGTVEKFTTEGQGVMTRVGSDMGMVSERVEPARAGMAANKLYIRIGHYATTGQTPVQLVIGLKNDGTIAGLQVRPAQ
jgi:hypothetical protein